MNSLPFQLPMGRQTSKPTYGAMLPRTLQWAGTSEEAAIKAADKMAVGASGSPAKLIRARSAQAITGLGYKSTTAPSYAQTADPEKAKRESEIKPRTTLNPLS